MRRYHDLLKAWLNGNSTFPLRFAVGRLSDDFTILREYIPELTVQSKRYGFRIESERRNSRRLGEQDFPVAIYIDSLEIVLNILGKQKEFEHFQNDVGLIRTMLPALEAWMEQNPRSIIEYHDEWSQLLEVCQFLMQNPKPDLFIRELPISPHTKFVETHKRILRSLLDHLRPASLDEEQSDFARRYGLRTDESSVRLRLLDNQLERRYGLAIDDLSIPISQLEKLNLQDQVGLIVENKTSFLTLPFLSHTFAIFGSGFDVTILKQVNWLKKCRLLYWGDLDAQGFEILAFLRRALPQVQSVMMDNETFENFTEFVVSGTPAVPTRYPELTDKEVMLYLWLADNNLRLEQERIQSDYIVLQLSQSLDE
jgi:hypothetical protein